MFAGGVAALARRWFAALVLALVLGLAPNILNTVVLARQSLFSVHVDMGQGHATTGTISNPLAAPTSISDIASLAGAELLMLGAGLALAMALSTLTVATLTGSAKTSAALLADGLRRAPALAATALLYVLAVAGGTVLLIVPGLMMVAAWSVVFPVQVSEPTTVLGAFRRSAELTRGYRWLILGLRLAAYICWFVLRMFVSTAVLTLPGPVSTAERWDVFRYALAPLISTLFDVSLSVLVASFYVELRRAKEGLPPGSMDDVFA